MVELNLSGIYTFVNSVTTVFDSLKTKATVELGRVVYKVKTEVRVCFGCGVTLF